MPHVARTISLRPIGAADDRFLYELYASTRADELAPLGWDGTQRTAFVQMQLAAQTRSYRQEFPDAAFDVILVDEQPAGRLYVDRQPGELRIVDIALLPEYRNTGVGTELLRGLQADVARSGGAIRLHVDRSNRALGLYTRLGFQIVADTGVYLQMAWPPSATTAGGPARP
jgi:ribosomal protein S18 acetylase RimI-like enzyme